MQIKKTSLNFTSRNPEIRFADDIARKVNNVCQAVSSTKFDRYSRAFEAKYSDCCDRLGDYVDFSRQHQDIAWLGANTTLDKYKTIIDFPRFFAAANCGELSEIACVSAKLNGIKSSKLVRLFVGDKPTDHNAVRVKFDKKECIIDPWLAIADYTDNIFEQYVSLYSRFLGLKDCKPCDLSFVKFDDELGYCQFMRANISASMRRKLKELYPELLIERKK